MNCQDHLYRNADPKLVSRRWFFQECGVGLGAIALSQLLGITANAAAEKQAAHNPLAPKQPHYQPKAKRIIFLFMAGAPSPLELVAYKPRSAKLDRTLPPADLLKGSRPDSIHPSSQPLR